MKTKQKRSYNQLIAEHYRATMRAHALAWRAEHQAGFFDTADPLFYVRLAVEYRKMANSEDLNTKQSTA